MPRKTATIERFHMYGTPRYCLHLLYRGSVVQWSEGNGVTGYAQTAYDDAEALQAMRDTARRFGFTHVRIAGDWQGRTKPKGGKL